MDEYSIVTLDTNKSYVLTSKVLVDEKEYFVGIRCENDIEDYNDIKIFNVGKDDKGFYCDEVTDDHIKAIVGYETTLRMLEQDYPDLREKINEYVDNIDNEDIH